MNNSSGSKLIKKLLTKPSKFNNQGRAYQLLQQYFEGFPLETLQPLLHHKDPLVRRAAVWIVSELGIGGSGLLNDAIPLINDDERYVKYHALEIVSVCSVGGNANQFKYVIPLMECNDDVIRILVMRLVSNADLLQLEAGARFFGLKDSYHKLHNEGLTKLLEVDRITPEQVALMINNDEPLTRKYGIIIAKRLFTKFPNLIIDAVMNGDNDISKFSQEVVEIYSGL